MMLAKTRFEPADERLVCEKRIKIGGRLGDANALHLRRDRTVEIAQRFAVIEPAHLGHEAFDEMQEPLGAIDEAREPLPGVDALLRAAFKKPGFGARTLLGGRQPDEGQIVAALEVRAFLAKLLAALDIDEPRDGIGK